ncbi:MAG: hypothetical protein IPJ40_18950 [Saprospirales bacterium]|nr:hypothetical protein [Saprospirales bacterium]
MLQDYAGRNNSAADRVKYSSADPKRITDRVLASVDFKQQCKDKLDDLLQQLNWYKTWGERVNVKDFKYLRDRGIYIRLYSVDKAAAQSLSKDHCVAAFPERDGKIPIALFTRDESEKLDLKEAQLPSLPIKEIRRQITRKKRQLTEAELYLEDQADSLELLYDLSPFFERPTGVSAGVGGHGRY